MSNITASAPAPATASNAAHNSANAASASASGTTSPLNAAPAQPTARSYASATKKQVNAPAIASSSPSVAVGASQPVQQHGKPNAVSPVNGQSTAPPAVPSVAPPIVHSAPIANGAASQPDHSRKSSVTISSSQGYPNGGPTGAGNRASIQFGSMNAGGSPAIANSVPHIQQNSLPTPPTNPRVISPANSPSPIPQPISASGGRPPSMGSQGMSVNFGATGGDSHDSNMRAVSMPQGPSAGLAPQPQHLRRESSQSAHSDMSAGAMHRTVSSGNGRGRGYQPNFGGPQMAASPAPAFRQLNHHQRGAPQSIPPFQAQGAPMRHPASPYQAHASPSMRPAMPQQSPHLVNSAPMAYGGYPPHLQPQVNQPISSRNTSASADSTFSTTDKQQLSFATPQHFASSVSATQYKQPQAAFPTSLSSAQSHQPFNMLPDLTPASSGYEQYLTILKQQAMYGIPQPYDPQFAQFYPQQSYMHPGMPYSGAPPSPRPQFNAPHAAQPAYVQGQYGHPMPAPGMHRTGSQGQERPPSAMNQPPTPSMQPTPTQSSASPAPPTPSSNFTIPKPKSKGIVIKNDRGEVVTFDKNSASASASVSASPAPAPSTQPQAPPATASTPTPPPKSVTPQKQIDKEPQLGKTKEEIQAEFREKALRAQKGEEDVAKVEDATPKEESTTDVSPKPEKPETKAEPAGEMPTETPVQESKTDSVVEESEEERKKREEDEEMEKMIAEMEAKEKEDEEREKAYREKKAREAEEKRRKEEEIKANEDEELKRQEREAEAREEAREKARQEQSDDAKSLFATLAKPGFGPGALAASNEVSGASGTSSPGEEAAAPAPQQPIPSPLVKTPSATGKPKPAHLKLETSKPVEPAQPTAGMLSLKSARFLQVNEEIKYPTVHGLPIQSPNPAMNNSAKNRGRQYNKSFLLQFQDVFKEKPSPDWDVKVKETVGDGSTDSARNGPGSARTPSGMGHRQASRGGMSQSGTLMGAFNQPGGMRPLPQGTPSESRFGKTNMQPPMGLPGSIGSFSGRPGAPFGQMPRNPSQTAFHPSRMDSSRTGSSRRGGSKKANPREEAERAAKMPLTAGMDLKPLEHSTTGWKPTSIGVGGMAANTPPGGRLPPDLVQRKVKSALNKMTPEKFDKISNDILQIAAQSKDETDGRTLRQVIALTFEKACDEAHWSGMYAQFCKRMLETMSTDIKDENVKDKHGNPIVGGALFRKYLLNRCQEEFERGWEVNLPEAPEGQSGEAAMLSDEYYVAAAAKRRGLGLIQFIGELFKLNMLTARIMHECVMKLLNFEGTPDEAAIESLTKLLRTIGLTMEQAEAANPGGPNLTRVYFERIEKIIETPDLPSRLKFMLMDVVDLRRNGWRSKDDAKGPKTITQIHQEAQLAQQQAELERMRSQQRGGPGNRPPMGRGDARSFSGAGSMGPPQDYSRNTVISDDLKKLTRGTGRNSSAAGGFGGPLGLLSGSRSNSGRRGLGPSASRAGEESGVSSRTGTPPAEKKESSTSVNAFSALASLGDGENADDVASPPSNQSSPPVAKTTLASAGTRARSKSPLGQKKETDGGAGNP